MENETELDLDSQNEVSDSSTEDVVALKEKNQKLSDTNKQLYARAKKAEGFELVEGKWVKPPQEAPKVETEPKKESDGSNELVEKAFLRAAGITDADEVDLALSTAKKWDMPVDKLVDDEDFKVKLEKLQTQKSNELATSGIKGSPGTSQAKQSAEYWIAKGQPPSPEDVPDRKTRATIVRALMADVKKGKTFYND